MVLNEDRTFLVMSYPAWGKGGSETEAIKNMKKTKLYGKGNPITLYLSPDPDVFVDEFGYILTKPLTEVIQYGTLNKQG